MRLLPSPAEVLVTTTELSRRARLDSNRFVRIDRNASATFESGSRALSSTDAWLCTPRMRGTTPTTGTPRTCSASVLDLIVLSIASSTNATMPANSRPASSAIAVATRGRGRTGSSEITAVPTAWTFDVA